LTGYGLTGNTGFETSFFITYSVGNASTFFGFGFSFTTLGVFFTGAYFSSLGGAMGIFSAGLGTGAAYF